jgi:hypothetical protein
MGPETVGALVTFLHAERDERIDRSRAASWDERGAKSGHREYGEDPRRRSLDQAGHSKECERQHVETPLGHERIEVDYCFS